MFSILNPMLITLWKKESFVYSLKQESKDLFTLKLLKNSLISPFCMIPPSTFFSCSLLAFFYLPTKFSIDFTSKTRRIKSIRACVWSDYWVIWCKQYLILLILLFSSLIINVKLQISFLSSIFSLVFYLEFCPYTWFILFPTLCKIT